MTSDRPLFIPVSFDTLESMKRDDLHAIARGLLKIDIKSSESKETFIKAIMDEASRIPAPREAQQVRPAEPKNTIKLAELKILLPIFTSAGSINEFLARWDLFEPYMDASEDVKYSVWLPAFLPPDAYPLFATNRGRTAIRTALKQRYPTNDVSRFFSRSQLPNESVQDYATTLASLNKSLGLNQPNAVLINTFSNGLRSLELQRAAKMHIQQVVDLTFDDFVKWTVSIVPLFPDSPSPPPVNAIGKTKKKKCAFCHRLGHWEKDCRTKAAAAKQARAKAKDKSEKKGKTPDESQ